MKAVLVWVNIVYTAAMMASASGVQQQVFHKVAVPAIQMTMTVALSPYSCHDYIHTPATVNSSGSDVNGFHYTDFLSQWSICRVQELLSPQGSTVVVPEAHCSLVLPAF